MKNLTRVFEVSCFENHDEVFVADIRFIGQYGRCFDFFLPKLSQFLRGGGG